MQENIIRVLSGNFQYKFRPFISLFNPGHSWLPPGSQVKLRVDLPQGDLSRYLIISNKRGGANSADAVSDVRVELLELDFVYPTYRMKKDYSHQVSIAKELYFHTWCPRLIQKQLNDDAALLRFCITPHALRHPIQCQWISAGSLWLSALQRFFLCWLEGASQTAMR